MMTAYRQKTRKNSNKYDNRRDSQATDSLLSKRNQDHNAVHSLPLLVIWSYQVSDL